MKPRHSALSALTPPAAWTRLARLGFCLHAEHITRIDNRTVTNTWRAKACRQTEAPAWRVTLEPERNGDTWKVIHNIGIDVDNDSIAEFHRSEREASLHRRSALLIIAIVNLLACVLTTFFIFGNFLVASTAGAAAPRTSVSIANGRWQINGQTTYPRAKAEGLLLNVRMVNATFEDRKRPEFDAEKNTDEFIAHIPDYVAHGVRAFTLNLQGGMPGYEGAANSAFAANGALRDSYLKRVRRVIEECDQHGAVVILGCYYQRQDQLLQDEAAVRTGVINTVKWIQAARFSNVVLEIANEFGHGGFDHRILKRPEGQVELIRLARETAPDLLVGTSGLGDGLQHDAVARVSDFLLVHFNSTRLEKIPKQIAALKKYGKPIVCNEDQKWGEQGAKAAEVSVANGASWGLMLEKLNQHFPFTFQGAADDPAVYAELKRLAVVLP
jgi:hypothetical protein